MVQNTIGVNNISLGNSSLYNNTIGNYNISAGQNSLYSNTEGNNNVALGSNALRYNTTGNTNVALGYNVQSGDFSNSVILGNGATATANSQFVLGSAGTPIGPVTTESCTSTKTLTIRLNGADYKILLV